MKISAISFSGDIIKFPRNDNRLESKQDNILSLQQDGDVFVKSVENEESKELKIKSLNDYNSELDKILTDLRYEKASPEYSAFEFMSVLRDKQLAKCFDDEIEKIGTVPKEEINFAVVERFYDLTFVLQNKLDESLEDNAKKAMITSLLNPFDSRYEEFCVKCDEVFCEDDDDEENDSLNLNSLVDIDDKIVSKKKTNDVINGITESLKNIFSNDSEPEFNIHVKVGSDYNEEKFVNACKKLFSLVSTTIENPHK